MSESELMWFPLFIDRLLASESWRAMEDFQRGWYLTLLLESARSTRPGYLYLIYSDDMDITEREMHDHYAQRRTNGEWFRLTSSDLEEIRSIWLETGQALLLKDPVAKQERELLLREIGCV